jgi:hypothetical protein
MTYPIGITCQELVELVTEYLEGPSRLNNENASSSTWPRVLAVPTTCSRCV